MKVIKFILNVIKGILGMISDICFIILFVYGATFIPYLLGYKAITISSGDSFYKEGTLIYYRKVDLGELRVSNHILEKKDSKSVIYVIKDLVDDNIDVGDNNKITFDENIFKVGDVSVPYLGYYVRFLNNNKQIVFILLAVIVFDMVFGGIRFKSKKKPAMV